MVEGLNIRQADESDVDLILQLIKGLAEFEKLSHEVVADETALRQTLFVDKHAEVIIGEYNEKPVSFALFFHNYSTFLARPGIYLEDLFVMPEARSHGVGKAMLQFIAGLAKQRGCGRLEWSVLNWNQRAISFYQSLGAKPMDEWTVYRLDQDGIAGLAAEKTVGS